MVTVSIRPAAGTDLVPADVRVDARSDATVLDLARALGRHLAPERGDLLLAPTDHGEPWPAGRRLADRPLRDGDVVDVTVVPRNWVDRPARPARERATVTVVAGPDAGRRVAVASDTVSIGRGPANTVELHDPLVSRRHARVLLDPAPVVVDEGSAHGTVVGDQPVQRATPLGWGEPLTVGDSVLVLTPAAGADELASADGVVRPPRFGELLEEDQLDLPAPPAPPKPTPLPWATLAMPLVLGFAMLAVRPSPFVLVYILGWPLIALLGNREQRRRQRRDFEEDLALWQADVDATLVRLDRYAAAQRDRALADHPPTEQLRPRAARRDATLWNRVATDPDFLAVRAGLGPVPALLTATLADGGDREVTARTRRALAGRRLLADLPVLLPLGSTRLAAVVGDDDRVDAALRALVVRLCTDHSPADVAVAAILGRRRETFETWLRWLPHVARRVGGVPAVAFGATEGQRLLERLADEDGRGVTVCLVDEDAQLPRRTVEAVADLAGDQLHLIWLGRHPHRVPAATDVMVDLTASVAAPLATADLAEATGEQPRDPVAVIAARDRAGVAVLTDADEVSLADAWHLARSLSGCSDEAAVLTADTTLPEQVRLSELAADLADPDDAAAVAERWASSRGLRATIGSGVDGAVTLDLREDGPHGLVAGTTGSGKSELLQTLICSLALNNPPERVTFLLVDYKGGAAFRECADLPHTVGYITDLSPALVQRALTSLGAEVTAREHLLDAYGAKDVLQLERDHPEVAPPALLICVDEFAALATEVPDFVDGVVNIAQRGRSLGLHLLLATQRPAGVVTANIRANTDLRIALRVASVEDSSDVIDRPDAAHISRRTPGRAWIRRTGHGTAELVQTAWVGAREELAGSRAPVSIAPFTAHREDRADDLVALGVHERTDLERLVVTTTAAFARSGAPAPSRPWLPPLPATLHLAADRPGAVRIAGTDDDRGAVPLAVGQVPVGLRDAPQDRAQPTLVLDYPQVGHVLVYGASGAGKSELLRSVAVSASLADAQLPPYVYVLDFAGGGLSSLEELPTVGAVIGEQQIERVMRLLRMLDRTVTERSQLLASTGATDIDHLAATGHALPRIHVLVDNLVAFLEAFDGGGAVRRQHGELLTSIVQNGRRVGVHVTGTAPTRVGLPSATVAAFGTRVVLRMTTDDDHTMLGAPAGILTSESPPGRGLVDRAEVQVAACSLATGGPLEGALTALAEATAERPATPVLAMPGRVPAAALPAPDADRVPIGVDADTVGVLRAALRGARLLLAGRRGSGRTSALLGLAELARRSDEAPAETVWLGPTPPPASAGDVVDVVVDDLAAVTAWADGVRTRAAADDGWRLVLVDDLHVWERAAESDPAAREALLALVAVAEDAPALRCGVVGSVDSDEARARQHLPGLTQTLRRSRQGVLLQPDGSDGSLLGVQVPIATVEPLHGPGRGLWCLDGTTRVVQVLAATAVDELTQ